MTRNAASAAFLEGLMNHEAMPQPLGAWCRETLDCGVGGTLNRLALAAALEGCCGIPPVHRETRNDPAQAALLLARLALESLHHWWPKAYRAAQLARVEAAAGQGQTARVLGCWCIWNATERAKRRADAAVSQLEAA